MKRAAPVAALARPPAPVHEVTIYVGGVHASREPTVVRTTLGSCVAVCLFERTAGVGGMNHFMLPDAPTAGDLGCTRWGASAMEALVGALQRLGARRDRLQAKVFGGGHVLDTEDRDGSVPRRNAEFVERYLMEEGIEILATDLGGFLARHVKFHSWDGRAFCRRLPPTARRRIAAEDQLARRESAAAPDVELFE